ncbi:MAG TPA: hypothetical protein VE011_07550 [Candidatus Dormibacteraeota bacterium]|nr:hypothetical protein [Candidatus Dormibacteraeota bacterium]
MVAIVGIEAAFRAWRGVPPAPLVTQLNRVMILVLIVTSAGGLGILLAGGGPHEPLHFLYAILAIGSLPVADSLARNASPRRRAVITLVAAIILFVLLARLFQTG